MKKKYTSGAQRDDDLGRGFYELLPPCVILRDAQLYERGSRHYGGRNWEKGIPSSRFMRSLLRHTFRHLEGDRSEDHPAAIRFNAAGLAFNEEMVKRGIFPPEIIDLPNHFKIAKPFLKKVKKLLKK